MRTLAVLITLVLTHTLLAAPLGPPEFTVTGYGKVFYTVDIADIQFSVSVRDKDVQQCKTKHDAIVQKLNEYLHMKNYPMEILSLEETILKRERRSGSRPENDNYLAKSTYSIRTERIGELSTLQADIVEIGVDEIQFVKLFSSKQRELEDLARMQSIEDAKSLASLTANLLGWMLDRPIRISYTSYPMTFGSRANVGGSGQGIASSNYVDSTVQITYSYKIEDETE